MLEVPGPAAFDRLSGLAARLVGAGHAKVTLFTDQDTVVGGFGLPPGVIGGPALLTGALSAIVVRQRRPLNLPDAAADERVAYLPAVTSGQVRAYLGVPLIAASGHAVGVARRLRPGAAPGPTTRPSCWPAGRLGRRRAGARPPPGRPSVPRSRGWRWPWRPARSASGRPTSRRGVMYWDERCAALFGVDGRAAARQVLWPTHPPRGPRGGPESWRAIKGAVSSPPSPARSAGRLDPLDGHPGPGGDRLSGEPVRLFGTILDVTEARRQAEQRLEAFHRATAIAEVAAELANAARLEVLAEIVLRGARVLGAQSSALTIFDADGGPLRLYMTRRLATEVQEHVDYPVEGVEIELDDGPAGPVRGDARPAGAAGRPGTSSSPGSPPQGGHSRSSTCTRRRPCPWRGGAVLGSVIVLWRAPPVRHQRRRGPGGAGRADRAERLAAAGRPERSAAVAAMARGERAAAAARRDRAGCCPGRWRSRSRSSELAELVVPELGDWCWIVVTDEQGRLHELGSAHRDPARGEEVEAYARAMVAVMTDSAGARVVTAPAGRWS